MRQGIRIMRLLAAMQGQMAQGQMSFGDIREMVSMAICARAGEGSYCYIADMYPDSVVYELGNDETLYQSSYAIVDGNVTLGDPVKVERQVSYIPLQAAGKYLAAVGDPGDDSYGYVWRVQVVEYGLGKDGRINWPREPLAAALSLYDGARVFALNDSQHEDPKSPRAFGKSVREIVGWLKNPVDTGTGIEADFHILKSAKWLRDDLVDSFDRDNPGLLGLSHDVVAKTTTKMVAGKRVKEPVEITRVEVDVVYDPTNNGKFLRMAAARQAGQEEDDKMLLQKLLAALQKTRPDLHKQITDGMTAGTIIEDQAVNMVAAATVKEAGGNESNEKLVAAVVAGLKASFANQGESEDLKKMKLVACSISLREQLTESKLPDAIQAKLRTQFADRVFEDAELTAAIKIEKETYDKLVASGVVHGLGGTRIQVTRESGEKLQAAMDKMIGVRVDAQFNDIQPLTSLLAAYVEITGDSEVRGYADQTQRMQAAFDSTTFAYVLGNALYRRMVQDYRETTDFGLSRLISNVRNARDFRPLQAIRIAYFGDIPDVNPENNDYADLGTLSDEKVEYSLNQKGGVITITRKMIINDDMTAVQRIVSRLPRAARRTKAKRAMNMFINNNTYKGDGIAVFHASHNNLGSAAYALTAAVAGRNAIAKQTEPGSGERLYLRPKTLFIPTDLWDAAVQLNQTRGVPGSNNLGNSMFQYFGANNENIIESPFMTDVTDWLMFADPNDVEILEVAYLNGQQEPEMFVADQPTVGQFFVADKIQYKIRDEYEFEIMDFRGGYKAVVAG